jgi:hypothetical protein
MSHKTTKSFSFPRSHPQTYKFETKSVFTDNGQDFINIESKFECADVRTRMSDYYVGKDGVGKFIDELVPLIAQTSGLTDPTLIGPTYYKPDGAICDYQCSVTGTAKAGETEIMTLQRELAEEIGFVVKSSAISSLMQITHTQTVKRGTAVRECVTFIINVADIEPATALNVRECIPFLNLPDFVGVASDGKPLEKKIQAFLYGDYGTCKRMMNMRTIKPVKYKKDDVARTNPIFYDADIKGLTIFTLEKIKRRFGVSGASGASGASS